jgi:putative transposase
MARLSRVVIPGVPHHVTQRGNGRQQTFFEPGDYALYLDLLAAAAARAKAEIWGGVNVEVRRAFRGWWCC